MAIKVWRGDAQGVAQTDKVTVENVEVGDVFTLTINRKAVSFTATANTPDNVYSGLATAITAAAITEFPSAVAVPAVGEVEGYLLLTGLADGTPYTVEGSTTNGGTADVDVDVVQSGGGGVNMIQRVALPAGITSGSFTLSFEGQTTSSLTYDESAADIETALKALSNIGASDVSVSGNAGGPWLVEFEGTKAAATQTLLSGNGSSLAGQTVTVTTTANGQGGDNHRFQITGTQLLSETKAIAFYLLGNEPDATASGAVGSNDSDAYWLSMLAHVYGLATSDNLTMVRTTTTNATQRIFTIDVEIIAEKAGVEVQGPTVTRWSNSASGGYDTAAVVSTTLIAAGGNSTNETQVVTLPGNPTGGTFTLTFQGQTTAAIAYNASTSALGSALEALSNIGSGDVSVTGSAGSWTVEFTNALAATDLAAMTGSGANLTGGTIVVSTTQAAVPNANEQVLISLSDNVSGGTFTLTYDSSESANIAYNASAATLQTALEGTASISSGDVNVSGPAGGPWLVEFTGTLAGQNVTAVTSDGTNLTGSGTQGITVTPDTTPTGPYHWDNADNWDAGSVPTDSDTAVFEDSSRPVKYGLDQSAVTLTQLEIRRSYTGTIGLPDENELGYIEYRDTHLQIGATTVLIGEGEGSGSERIRLDLGSVASAVHVYGTASPANTGEYAVDLIGTNAANDLYIYQGSVSVGKNSGDTSVIDDLHVGYADDQASDVDLLLGDDVTLDDVKVHGGIVRSGGRSSSAITSLLVTAGEVYLNGTDGVSQLDIEGGSVYYRTTGTLGGNTVVGGSGLLSFAGDLRAKTVTNAITCRGDEAGVDDPQESVSSLVVAYQSTTRLPELGTNFTVTRS